MVGVILVELYNMRRCSRRGCDLVIVISWDIIRGDVVAGVISWVVILC